jgi:hypothetical protein
LSLYTTFFLIIKRHFKTMDCPPLPLNSQEFEEEEEGEYKGEIGHIYLALYSSSYWYAMV